MYAIMPSQSLKALSSRSLRSSLKTLMKRNSGSLRSLMIYLNSLIVSFLLTKMSLLSWNLSRKAKRGEQSSSYREIQSHYRVGGLKVLLPQQTMRVIWALHRQPKLKGSARSSELTSLFLRCVLITD